MRNTRKYRWAPIVGFVAWSIVCALVAPVCFAQRFAEPDSTPGYVKTPVPPINQCFVVNFDKSGAAYSQQGTLSFNEVFQQPASGCLAQKMAEMKPMFLYRYWPNPSALGPLNRQVWTQGCEAHCDWLQSVAISAVTIDEVTWAAGNCRNLSEAQCRTNYQAYVTSMNFFREQFPLLSASQYMNLSSPACSDEKCATPLQACKVRCGQDLPRQCYWQSWCKTPSGEQRQFCDADVGSRDVNGNIIVCPDKFYADDTAVEEFVWSFFGWGVWPSGDTNQVTCLDAVPAVQTDAWKDANCKGLTQALCDNKYATDFTHVRGKCVTGSFALDSECKLLTKDQAKGCINSSLAALRWAASSPISLLWKPGISVRESASIVKFKLDDSSGDTWYRWYGSGDAPLLVYDPQHSGRIDSAHQLFGNWTFGGQRVAALALGSTSATPWNNGYEALETLDRDGDSIIKGEELAPLGLWFDSNRDARAQPGEVRDIREAGVVSLAVGPQKRDALTGDVSVHKGFERLIDGRLETGESVDWFSDGAATMQQLVLADQLRLGASNSGHGRAEDLASPQENEVSVASRLPNVSDPREEYAQDSKIAGIWRWGSRDENDLTTNQGLLAIRERKDGKLEVLTVGELGVRDTTGTTRALQRFYRMTGSVSKAADGSIKLSFKDPHKSDSESTAIFDAKEGVLRGETTQRIVEIKGTTSIKYSWQAIKTLQE